VRFMPTAGVRVTFLLSILFHLWRLLLLTCLLTALMSPAHDKDVYDMAKVYVGRGSDCEHV